MADNQFIIRKGLIALDDSQITGSLSVTNSVTASFFTGSYRGDGSQLTGIEGFPFTGSAGITGSLTVVGPVNATTFTGDGSQLTGIEGFPFTGSAKITGSLEVTGSVTATSFTGSIQGTATSASYVQLANVDGFTAYSASVNTAIDSVLDATTPITATVNTTNSPFTVTSQSIVIIDSTNGDITVNLPDLNAINGTPDQKPILLYKNDYSQNVIYVQPSGSQLVNGTTQDIIVSIQIAIAYNPTSAGWVTEGTSYQSLAELEMFFVPRTETGSFATTGSNQFSGSQAITGSLTVTGGIVGTTSTASYVEYTNVANKPALVSGSSQISFNGITDKPTLVSGSSQITYSGLTGIPSGIVSSSAQVAGYGVFATTGSNTFQANQVITGSLFITQNLVVAGSSSIQYISSSVLDIADNIITVNAFNPAIRFGGLAVIDSGSSPQVSGSMLFDSIKDQWIFVHQNQSVVTSSVVLMGPETYNDLGNETYLSANRLPKGSGVEHLRDSNISDTGTVVSINSNTQVTGSLIVTGSGIRSNGPEQAFTWQRTTGTASDVYSLNADSGAAYLYNNTTANTLMSWLEGGNVGIGTNNPGYKLEIQTSSTSSALWVQTGGTTSAYAIADFRTGTNLPALRILGDGTATFGSSVTAVNAILSGTGSTFADGLRINRTTSNSTQYTVVNHVGGATNIISVDQSGNNIAEIYFKRSINGTTTSDSMVIDANGRVGIGISSPNANSRLHVYRGGGSYDTIIADGDAGTNTGYAIYEGGSPRYALYSNGAGGNDSFNIYNFGASSNSLTITTGGNVGIGNTTPNRLLSLYATTPVLQFVNPTTGITANDGTQFFQNAANFTLELQDSGYFNILTGGSERMRIIPDTISTVEIVGATANNDNYPRLRFKGGTYPDADSKYPYIQLGNGGLALSIQGGISTTYNNPTQILLNNGNISFSTATAASSPVSRMEIDSLGYVITDTTSATNGGLIARGIEYSIKTVGSLSGYTQGAIVVSSGTDASPSARGQGIFYFNEGNDVTWYNGGLYNATDRFDICRKSSTSAIDASTAQTAYTLFNLNSSGAAYNATGTWGTISSDQRLKENIVDATSKLDDVMSLKVRNFNYIGKEEKYIGFIAQELEQVFPSLVTTNDMREFDRDGNVVGGLEDTKGVKVGMDFAILVKAIQEQQSQIEILKAEIQTLKQ